VPDGEYIVYAEFTDKHAQGPLYSINFIKGTDPVFISPDDETYFKDIVINFTPYICEFSANLTDVCEGSHVIFTDESVNASSWEWNFGEDAVPATASTEGPHQVYYNSPGKKDVSLSINGSVTETKLEYISIISSPAADFNFSGSNMTVDFMNTSVNASSYSWDFGDGNISDLENPTHEYANSGTYLVNLIAGNTSCYDTVFKEVMVPLVGVQEFSKELPIKVFPNPSTGKFYINVHDHNIETIRLIDLSGQLVQNIPANASSSLITVDLGNSMRGIYILEIGTDQEVFTRKVFIR
jgi:PKD repeat protein